jgi:serine/threonine-protein kinase
VSAIDPEWRFDPGGNPGVSLSPDGARLAVTIMGDVTGDIWVKELPQGPLTRLTFGSGQEIGPRWTADGRVTYVSVQEGPGALHARLPDGTGSADLLLSHERQIWEGILSDDGEWVIARVGTRLSVAGQAPGMDVIGMRPARDTEATVSIATEFDEKGVMLSPDGRWLAYVSDETGRNEVYVRPFPGVDAGKTTVSVNGGVMPLWSRSGEEIFYVSQREMVAARISTVPAFGVRSREVLFPMSPFPLTSDYTLHDIAPDAQRFVMLRREETPGRELMLVLNWFEELEARVPR